MHLNKMEESVRPKVGKKARLSNGLPDLLTFQTFGLNHENLSHRVYGYGQNTLGQTAQ